MFLTVSVYQVKTPKHSEELLKNRIEFPILSLFESSTNICFGYKLNLDGLLLLEYAPKPQSKKMKNLFNFN